MSKPDFRQFYERHVDKIHRFLLLRVGGNRPLAEDLTSEVFLKALEAYDRYDPEISGSAWIYTIARNHLANHWRTSGRIVDDDISELPIAAKDFLEGVTAEEERKFIREALGELNPEQRQLIEMKHLLGYAHKEIAAITGKSVVATKVATHRAMKRFTEICTSRSKPV